MRKISGILSILSLVLLTSCMAMEPGIMITDTINLNGTISDDTDNPIEHIKVTFEWESPFSPLHVYSSANGIFSADLEFSNLTYPITISVTLSDDDGPEYGGEFETKTDEITIPEAGPLKPITYRLTRATASESSPQSL
jgi:hypothetical protein